MISVAEAFSILEKLDFRLKEIEVPLVQAHQYILAETICSPINMPPFRQSNMDGFALALHEKLTYEIVGEVKAGDSQTVQLKPGQAAKIFTGAPVPDSAQAVIQIEKVSTNGHQLLLDEAILPGTNVRPLGSQIRKTAVALEKGTFLSPAAIGFLAGLGLTSIKVFNQPKVGIIVTGNELAAPGNPLQHGQVYESNAIMLQAALQSKLFNQISLYQVDDDFENTQSAIKSAIEENDLLMISGGISVGDYDFVGKALQQLNVETLFYKVNQKPGKPLFAGKYHNKMIFALPGNPAASLTCFYVYVWPTLQKMSGHQTNYGTKTRSKLAHDLEVNNPRDQFLKAIVSGEKVTVLDHQDSSMLDTFALANALVYVPGGNYRLPANEPVALYLL
ncbi:molybdopterin molybdotransferase MoeA [Flavobacterium sp. CYK-4]|uniref:molybdopterin molybdotransferase MoeA n=1 Tax=Flavobacterium lotistagni TaxID=2709660 RepID=UPI0014088236|nr:gephyrin-like molybdotransferase Glp [Flavobacterium lotistagni]NHM07105.1 molybdopterin molybdotransferase MoeA [Flavobacterium lotistagni]